MSDNQNLPPKRGRWWIALGLALVIAGACFIVWTLWGRSNRYLIRSIISDASSVSEKVLSEGPLQDSDSRLQTGAPDVVELDRDEEEVREEQHTKEGQHYVVLTDWARALAHARHLEEAFTIARKIKDDDFRALAYAKLASACAEVKDTEGMQEAIRLADAEVQQVKQTRQISVLIEIVKAQTLAEGREAYMSEEFDKALRIADKQSHPEQYRLRAYLELASGLTQEGKVEDAGPILEKAAEELNQMSCSKAERLAVVNFTRVAVKANRLDLALQAANQTATQPCFFPNILGEVDPWLDYSRRAGTQIEIAEVFAEAGQGDAAERSLREALRLTESMRNAGRIRLVRDEVYNYARIAKASALAGKAEITEEATDIALNTLRQFEADRQQIDWSEFAYAEVAKNLALAGKVDAALYILQKQAEVSWLRYVKERVVNWSERPFWTAHGIAIALAEADKIDEARNVMRRYREILYSVGDRDKNSDEYGVPAAIVKSLARQGRIDEAASLINEIKRDDVREIALADFATVTSESAAALAHANKRREAETTLAKALDAARRISHERLRSAALSAVAKGWASLGDYRRAREICADALAIDKLGVYSFIVNMYAGAPVRDSNVPGVSTALVISKE